MNGAHAGLAAGLFFCLTMQFKPRQIALHGRVTRLKLVGREARDQTPFAFRGEAKSTVFSV